MRKIQILYGVEAANGGVLKHLLYLIANLDKKRFAITIALSDSRGNIDEEIGLMKEHGVKVVRIRMVRSISPIQDLMAFFKICFLLKRVKYDVVHAHSSKAGALFCAAAWLYRVPKIFYTPHCFFFQGRKGFKKMVFILLEKVIGMFYSGVIVSDNEKYYAIHHCITRRSKIRNINNAIKFDSYPRVQEVDELRRFYGFDQNDVIVGSVGRLTTQKDWYTYIYAANRIVARQPNVKFLVVGDGELTAELMNLVLKLNIQRNILFTGYIKKIYQIYSILDIFVNTSQWEGLPYVFLEAMHYKLPIVATDTGNNTAIIHGETGYIADAKDFETIACYIQLLIDNNAQCTQMGVNAMNHVKARYSFDSFIELHQQLYSG